MKVHGVGSSDISISIKPAQINFIEGRKAS